MKPQTLNAINLSELESPRIDLSSWPDGTVMMVGSYQGPRIVLSGVSNKTIMCCGASIESNHAEDALCVDGDAENFTLQGQLSMNGALSLWGAAKTVLIDGITIEAAHTGIRSTKPGLRHDGLTIRNCVITRCSHEGIYIGPSTASNDKGKDIVIQDNDVSDCGWDGIQVGNAEGVVIEGNTVTRCGTANEFGQDYGITINPGCRDVILARNTITETAKQIQMLESTGKILPIQKQQIETMTLGQCFIITGPDGTMVTTQGARVFIHEWPFAGKKETADANVQA